MPYPFENKLLDSYLVKHRQLKEREHGLYLELYGKIKARERLVEIYADLNAVHAELLELRNATNIPKRTCDVFLSERDLINAAFHRDNPKPEYKTCSHRYSEKRLHTHGNGTKHVTTQCLECGMTRGGFRRETIPNWESLPPVDTTLAREFNKATSEWYEKRAAMLDTLPPANDIPSFDRTQFDETYKRRTPPPLTSQNCLHETQELTWREYKTSGPAVVRQCIDCGKHCKSVSKSGVPKIEDLPPFDELKEPALEKANREWHSSCTAALKEAKQAFDDDIAQKIHAGQLKVVDATTFGTYYDSSEWTRTRERILDRDRYQCQVACCSSAAAQVHHITYDRLGCENDLDLISLCEACHNVVHKKQDEYRFQYRLTASEIQRLARD